MSGFNKARLVAEVTEPEDTTGALSISHVDDELVNVHIYLSAMQLRELAADLVERADYLDRVPGRNRKTPAWHHRNGVRLLAESDREHDPAWAAARAEQAAAHFQAALSLIAQTGRRTNPSRKDTP